MANNLFNKFGYFLFAFSLTIIFGISSLLILKIPIAHATAPNPAWWVDNFNNFSQYDDYQYKNGRPHQGNFYSGSGVDSNILDANATYDGVSAVGPRPAYDGVSDVDTFFTSDSGSSQEEEWECTELVKRFLYLEYGTASLNRTNGYQVVNNYTTTYPTKFRKIPNDGSMQVYPKPGDILSYGTSSPGHTALVKSVTNQSNGTATVQLIEQNSSSTGLTNQTFTNWQFQNGIDDDPNNVNTVTGWLTPLGWTDVSPSGTTYDQINGMAASSPTNVWAVGQELGGAWQPVTYRYTGVSFNKIYPPSQGSNSNHFLKAVAVNSSGDAWILGTLQSSPSYNTLAYHWNGSSWVTVQSENPAYRDKNEFDGAAIDPSGNVWAVGYWYRTGFGPQILIEKWNGTKFATPSATFGFGALNSVSFSSSTNGWAVGYQGSNYVIFHYDGTSWTLHTLGTGNNCTSGLSSVVAVSDIEAWAAGCGTTGMLHYTTANGWQQYTGFTPTGGINYVAVGSGASDVWMSGTKCASLCKPYTIHYDGTKWSEVVSPTYTSGNHTIQSITAIPGYAWAGGYYLPQGAPSNHPSPLIIQSW